MAPQLAWIGLGNMGRGMVKNLVEKGNLEKPLIIFNRTQKRATDFAAQLPSGKTVVASNLDEVAFKADIIFTSLGGDASVIENIEVLLKGDVKGKLFVDCSTIHPDTTEAIAKTVQAQGADFVACPVFGAKAVADAGQLVCVPAGPGAAVKKVLPYCKGVIGKATIDFSDQPHGKATSLKIIGNTVIINMVESLSEGHTLAEKSGVGTDAFHQFIEFFFPGPYAAYSTRLMNGDYYKNNEPPFGAALARKDARHAMNLAKTAGVKLGVLEVADGHLAQAEQHMGAKADITGIYGVIRAEAGLKFEN